MNKYFVELDAKGFIEAYYNNEVHDIIPEQAIEITEAQWQEALTIGANKFIDGKFIFFAVDLTPQEEREAFKFNRADLISNMTVVVEDIEFDANISSRDSINAAISALDPTESTLWVLTDNSTMHVTREQLRLVLKAITIKHTSIWEQ